MCALAPLTLWTNLDRTRFFLIPDEQQLSSGEFRIHTVTGRKFTVDPEALTSFEISENEAKSHLESEFSKMLDGAHSAVDRFIDRLGGADQDSLGPVSSAIDALERALSRYTFPQPETEEDIRALRECAKRTRDIAERIQSLASR
jgi:hypothetical protein